MSGFSWYVAEGQGAAVVLGGIGEVDQGILDLGIRGTFSDPSFSDPDGGDMGRTGEAIILILTEVIPIPAMDTRIPSRSEPRFTTPTEAARDPIFAARGGQ